MQTPQWAALRPDQQNGLLQVLRSARGPQAGKVLELVTLGVGQPARLDSADRAGRSLLQHLVSLSTQRLHPTLARAKPPVTRTDLMTGVLRQTLQPDTIRQGNFETCVPTSMQYLLCRDTPAEYARMMAELTGPTGRAAMPHGGALHLQTEYLTAARRKAERRTVSEAIFQSAAMEFGNGPDTYDAATDRTRKPLGGGFDFESTGLDINRGPALAQRLLGGRFQRLSLDGAKGGARQEELMRLLTSSAPGMPIIVSMNVLPGPHRRGGSRHALTFLGLDAQGNVRLRDPYGPGTNFRIAGFRRVGTTGEYAVSPEIFRARVQGVIHRAG